MEDYTALAVEVGVVEGAWLLQDYKDIGHPSKVCSFLLALNRIDKVQGVLVFLWKTLWQTHTVQFIFKTLF